MFTSLAYAVILMGCSDDMTRCNEVARDNRAFATLAKCEDAQEKALLSPTARQIDYPMVAAQCVRGIGQLAKIGSTSFGQ